MAGMPFSVTDTSPVSSQAQGGVASTGDFIVYSREPENTPVPFSRNINTSLVLIGAVIIVSALLYKARK